MRLEILAQQLGEALRASGLMVVTAESCTGGWVAEAITDIAGSSYWFERGFVTYSNEAKQEVLKVRAETLACFGAVSEETVKEMAKGAIACSHAGISVAVSGIAGPGGGSLAKPVGTIWFAWALRSGKEWAAQEYFAGDRKAIRQQSVERALQGLLSILNGSLKV
ncbi:damage inducible protein CinA [Candidatus Nitrosoglobus terrae]|uniref:Damage inducible protein CinA n=1 Tax=Candidatus Nitrosoglobus terrae TaxID=1630141 RepID=A0A1Q2SNQ0_9GAMM|nr:nicotinamide-nucleotide amidase [Candidatus Nitrosoglobus terrae]BAW80764.1 damage inducible protein CinA [Candidatus Nitrosoglobus terrae]